MPTEKDTNQEIKDINQEIKEISEVISENKPAQSRLKIINNLCQYAPFFLFPILAESRDYKWWVILGTIIVVVCVGGLYMTIFRRSFMPKQVCKKEISKGSKFFYYSMMLVCPVLTVFVYAVPPFGTLINWILAIVFNFGLTMFLCYKVASK